MGKDSAAIGLRWELRDIEIIGSLAVVLWALVAAWIASLAGILSPAFFWIWWGLFFVGATTVGVVGWRQGARIERMTRWRWDEWVLAVLMAGLLALPLGMAICSPPNNADSLIYHLPRQIFWMAHGSVFNTEVPNPHMTKMPPLSELLGLNLYILSGTDRWHSLVQWFGLLGALAALGRVIELVGGSRRAQLAGCVFFASVPTVFFEASNTKNDILVAFFLLTVAWSLARAVLARRLGLEHAVIAGVGCGLALLTKGTAIAYLSVLAGAFLVVVILARVKLPLVSISVGVALVALLAAPHYLPQMTQIAASESGKSSNHANATIHPAAGGAVLAQNLALQLALPDSRWNERVAQVATYVSERLGFPPNDPRITFMETQFAVAWHPEHEDRATAFLHWMLLLGGVTVGWVWCPPGRRRSALLFGMTALGMLVVFSLLFRWQPWHGRLLIPCLGFGAVSVGLVVAEAGRSITILLMTLCSAWLLPSMTNSHRPVVGSGSVFRIPDTDVLRTIDVPEDAEAVRAAREVFQTIQPDRVLLRLAGDGIVHPVLRELKQPGRPWPELLLRPPEEGVVDVVLIKSDGGAMDSGVYECSDWHRVQLGQRWQVLLPPEHAEAVAAAAPVPAFAWSGETLGLGPVQGPYPEFGLPVFRNAYSPRMVLRSDRTEVPARLVLQMAAFAGPNHGQVFLDGRSLGEIKIFGDGRVTEFVAEISASAAGFELVVVFETNYKSGFDPAPVAARIFRMNLLPIAP